MRNPSLLKKIGSEALFILAPALLPILILPALSGIPTHPYTGIIGSLAALVLIFAVLLKADDKLLMVIRGTVIGLLYLFWLRGTLFSFEGFAWDSRYFALAIERFYHSFLPASHEYKTIHFSLPPLYFFLIGRLGALLKANLPHILKYSGYLFMVYLPYLWGYGLKGIFKEKNWYAAFLLSLLIPFKTYESWYGAMGTIAQKGWHFVGMFLIIIWYMWVRREKPGIWKAGLAAGLIFACDYYPFLPIFLAILIEIGTSVFSAKGLKRALQRLGYYARIGLVVIGVNLVWILPVLIDLLKHSLATSYNDWFHISGADFRNVLGFFGGFDFLSLIFIAGFVNIFINVSKSKEIEPLKGMLFGLFLFALVIYVLSLIPFTFLFANFSLMLVHLLALSCVLLMLHLGRKKSLPIVLLLIAASLSVLNQTEENTNLLESSRASSRRYRAGERLRSEIDFRGEIIFPYTNELLYGENTFSFISSTITYSDPAGAFEDRLEYVRNLDRIRSRQDHPGFSAALKQTPFGNIRYVLLKKAQDPQFLYFDLKIYMNDLKYPDKRGGQRDIRFSYAVEDFPADYFSEIYSDREFILYELR